MDASWCEILANYSQCMPTLPCLIASCLALTQCATIRMNTVGDHAVLYACSLLRWYKDNFILYNISVAWNLLLLIPISLQFICLNSTEISLTYWLCKDLGIFRVDLRRGWEERLNGILYVSFNFVYHPLSKYFHTKKVKLLCLSCSGHVQPTGLDAYLPNVSFMMCILQLVVCMSPTYV